MIKRKTLITGGSRSIGSALVKHCVQGLEWDVVNVDLLTYAAANGKLDSITENPAYRLFNSDITDRNAIQDIFTREKPDCIINLAAETNVDRSIDNSSSFIDTNIVGTATLLEAAKESWSQLPKEKLSNFRSHHASTDEVFGSLPLNRDIKFSENTPYEPPPPYSASKASSDHLARSCHLTYGLPALITNCSNNYGQYQLPEKLISLMIIKALNNERLPVYGNGKNVRAWLHVQDHVEAILIALEHGTIGHTYAISGNFGLSNLQVVRTIRETLDTIRASKNNKFRIGLIKFVADRLSHDLRYALDSSKIKSELGPDPRIQFDQGLKYTVRWFIENKLWHQPQKNKFTTTRIGKK